MKSNRNEEVGQSFQLQELESRTLASVTALPAVQHVAITTSLPAVQVQPLNHLPAVQHGTIGLPAVQR